MASIFDLFDKIRAEKKPGPGPVEWIIAGLGNPGPKYENSRHNVGFVCLDKIASEAGIKVTKLKFQSLVGDGTVGDVRCLLMKPSTFMNRSGEAIRDAMEFYKIPPERVLVIFDDISLEPGQMRIRRKGSDGGHNGMKNIIYLTGSDLFPRIKIGVGKKPRPDYDLAAWVLSSFSDAEQKLIDGISAEAGEAARLIVAGDIGKAMNDFNNINLAETPDTGLSGTKD